MADEQEPEGAAFGRLAHGPDPVLTEILYEPGLAEDREEVLPWLLRIDAAHVVMLARTAILARPQAAALLEVNRELGGRLADGEVLCLARPPHRGLYMVYERLYIDRLGEIGGAAHVARSRNDINSAVTRLRLRESLLALLDDQLAMVEAAAALARTHVETVMSGFTHLQPAQPTTFGHYLAAVSAEILRGLERLSSTYDGVNRSPLGGGAGLGTSFPIDRELTAALLGFEGVVDNSLDAVASRDYVLDVLGDLARLGVTLTRLALDLQLWGSEAYGFLSWPDELVSTSSMMPQKRNAFVLENVRGRAVRPAGALMTALLGLKNTPFSNSVEISSEATAPLWPALTAMADAARLLAVMLAGLEVRPARMRELLERGDATMTALADHLVRRHGLAFRAAHDVVGQLLAAPRRPGRRLPGEVRAALAELGEARLGRSLDLSDEEIAAVLDPEACARAAGHGGGAAPKTVLGQLGRLDGRRAILTERVASRRQSLAAAARRLDEAVDEVLHG